jgi:hypothetical protein
MAEGINVRFAGTLQQFIHQRVSDSGLYSSASEYIRDLVHRFVNKCAFGTVYAMIQSWHAPLNLSYCNQIKRFILKHCCVVALLNSVSQEDAGPCCLRRRV